MTCVALGALCAPAGSSADVLQTYQELAARRLSPAPLVPNAVPPSLTPLDRTLTTSPSRRRGGYALRMVHNGSDGGDAIIVLERGAFRTFSAALRDGRRLGFKARRTRVRGHPGYLLTRHLGPTQWSLVWREDGLVYTLGTGTPRKVSLKQLRATAAGLERLGRAYMGTPSDPESFSEAFAVTTERTLTVLVSWDAPCAAGDGSRVGTRVGNARVTLLPQRGDAFSFDIARNRVGPDAWTGTITPAAITLTIGATGSFDGTTCDSGPLTFTLDGN